MSDVVLVMGEGLRGWRFESGDSRLEEMVEVTGSTHINSSVPLLFLFSFLMFHISKYIRHEQRGFIQEDV
jgi:hypothetical protein